MAGRDNTISPPNLPGCKTFYSLSAGRILPRRHAYCNLCVGDTSWLIDVKSESSDFFGCETYSTTVQM